MRKLDLITGLLGAGKTTLLARYARFLAEDGQDPAVVVNDHGAVSVDGILLREELGEAFRVETVIDDGDADCHKRRVRAKLIALAAEGAGRVILEPSGVFEPEELFDLIREEPLDRFYEPGSVIAVLEAGRTDYTEADRFYLASQLAAAGAVVMSRTQERTPAEIEATLELAREVLVSYRCRRPLGDEVVTKPWEALTGEDFRRLAEAGAAHWETERRAPPQDTFTTRYFLNTDLKLEDLPAVLEALFAGAAGRVVRVKGFLPGEQGWARFNATADRTDLAPTRYAQRCFIVIGEGLDDAAIDRLVTGKG